ncbi:ABC transporter permease [Ruoffia tabacinasalis]|uniref:ABC transporter permease n=1 Tax=Ruoffia tabacinasalis TaxID=87458 RepID=A0ABS0LGT7_9LACT|nr:ABC transporter permease [Ruoffia tabacinasalis]MBG9977423.1 ABC transporter permease [Ruoffia tabacinasalis]
MDEIKTQDNIRNTQKTSTGEKVKAILANHSAAIALIFIMIIGIIFRGDVFFTYSNLMNVLMNNSFIGIISLGMTLIILTGNIDLAVGSQLALSGLVAVTLLNNTESVIIAILGAILVGAITGGLSGMAVSYFNIPSFIVTLGTMQIYRSFAQYFYSGGGVMASATNADTFTNISNYRLFGEIPMPIVYWIILSLLMVLFTRKTAFGRHIFAVGSNERATFLSSVNIHKIKIGVFIMSGVLVAIAGVLEASRLGSMNSASSGRSYEMDAIAAVVIGGTAMNGGRGSIIGTVFGTLTIGIINNLMNLLGVPSFLVGAIKGFIIIGAVMLQKIMSKHKE